MRRFQSISFINDCKKTYIQNPAYPRKYFNGFCNVIPSTKFLFSIISIKISITKHSTSITLTEHTYYIRILNSTTFFFYFSKNLSLIKIRKRKVLSKKTHSRTETSKRQPTNISLFFKLKSLSFILKISGDKQPKTMGGTSKRKWFSYEGSLHDIK